MGREKSTVAIVGNGVIEDWEGAMDVIRSCSTLVAVDGGLHSLHRMGMVPDLILGDLDSVDPEILSLYGETEVRKYPSEKDKSDMELAIEWAQGEADLIWMFGATGSRIDHTLYNIALLRRYPSTLRICTGDEVSYVITEDVSLSTMPGQRISLIPLSDRVEGVRTKGLKWELSGEDLSAHWMSLSNVAVGEEVEIRWSSGEICLVYQTTI